MRSKYPNPLQQNFTQNYNWVLTHFLSTHSYERDLRNHNKVCNNNLMPIFPTPDQSFVVKLTKVLRPTYGKRNSSLKTVLTATMQYSLVLSAIIILRSVFLPVNANKYGTITCHRTINYKVLVAELANNFVEIRDLLMQIPMTVSMYMFPVGHVLPMLNLFREVAVTIL